jgi:bacillithiol system protein YtxJ
MSSGSDRSRKPSPTLSVPHASPQVIVLRAGAPVWIASHRGIRAETLAEGIRSSEAVPGPADA